MHPSQNELPIFPSFAPWIASFSPSIFTYFFFVVSSLFLQLFENVIKNFLFVYGHCRSGERLKNKNKFTVSTFSFSSLTLKQIQNIKKKLIAFLAWSKIISFIFHDNLIWKVINWNQKASSVCTVFCCFSHKEGIIQ